ncbi:MAG: hypothetical protein WCH01_10830 [Methylococcaceae bacterium]
MPDYAEFWLPLGRNTLPLLHLWTLAVLQAILALHLANISAIHPKKFPGYTEAVAFIFKDSFNIDFSRIALYYQIPKLKNIFP